MVALAGLMAVTAASVTDNAATCGDDAVSGPCSQSKQTGSPAAPHTCTLCPCHTPSVMPRAAPGPASLRLLVERAPMSAAAPESLDAPAPLTPPPNSLA